jgi:threonine/homoserine/homoserine lactone efflux protein
MTIEQALAFLAFAVAVAGTPGPSNSLLTATGGRVGVLKGVPALLGVAVGMALLMFLVTFGLGAIILQTPLLFGGVKWVGAAVLVWFAWKIATTGASHGSGGARPVGFLAAAAFQWINPKSWLACTSAAGTYLDPSRGSVAAQAAILALLFVVAALPSCFVWLAFGSAVQRTLRSSRAARRFNLAMAGLLLASVVPLIT